jgi:hypothetical protein
VKNSVQNGMTTMSALSAPRKKGYARIARVRKSVPSAGAEEKEGTLFRIFPKRKSVKPLLRKSAPIAMVKAYADTAMVPEFAPPARGAGGSNHGIS